VPVGPILDYAQVTDDPHTRAREMVVEVDHPVEGVVRALGVPVKLSDTPGGVRRAAPLLGEHTDEVLREYGFSADEIAALR
jgi:formyl-CoA transferase